MTADGRSILILGTRGIPAAHGGFETFAERLALFLVERGWKVGVYCQSDVDCVETPIRTEMWNGIELIHIEVATSGPKATLLFDWKCVLDASRRSAVCLVLGYNGAVFLPWLRLAGRRIVTNMDGIEWRRPKWGLFAKTWFWLSEWIAAWTSHRLVADHPAIADHLARRRPRSATVMIPYGAAVVKDCPAAPVEALGLVPGEYLVSIARIEPDNNILTIVEAFSRKARGAKLVVLGTFDDSNPYHRKIRAVASDEVVFPGAIYDGACVSALRYHARAYIHGHTVGGTNPSLVESLAAGNAVIAHDNVFNRWTAGDAGHYFADTDGCENLIDGILSDNSVPATRRAVAYKEAARFDWHSILSTYESEILAQAKAASAATPFCEDTKAPAIASDLTVIRR